MTYRLVFHEDEADYDGHVYCLLKDHDGAMVADVYLPLEIARLYGEAGTLLEALEGLVARHTLPSGRCTECGMILIEDRCTAGCEVDSARAAIKAARG